MQLRAPYKQKLSCNVMLIKEQAGVGGDAGALTHGQIPGVANQQLISKPVEAAGRQSNEDTTDDRHNECSQRVIRQVPPHPSPLKKAN